MIKACENAAHKLRKSDPLETEGRLLRRLKDVKNVVNLVECFEQRDQSYLVLQHLEKGDLASYMVEHKIPFLTEAEMRSGVLQVLVALNTLHADNIVHNAIQPSHVLLREADYACDGGEEDYEVKLCGFGSAVRVKKP